MFIVVVRGLILTPLGVKWDRRNANIELLMEFAAHITEYYKHRTPRGVPNGLIFPLE